MKYYAYCYQGLGKVTAMDTKVCAMLLKTEKTLRFKQHIVILLMGYFKGFDCLTTRSTGSKAGGVLNRQNKPKIQVNRHTERQLEIGSRNAHKPIVFFTKYNTASVRVAE